MGRKALKLAVIVLFLFSFVWICRSILKIVSTEAPDFRVLWLATNDFWAGKNFYLNSEIFTGVGYPPNTLLFYLPFIRLPYLDAQALFTILSLASIVTSVLLSLKIAFGKIPWHYFLFALSLTLLSFPAKFTLGMGQNNALVLLIILGSFYFYLEKRSNWAGILLGLAISFKTIFGFFLLFFVLKRQWKMLVYFVLIILMSIGLTGLITNLNLYGFYISKVLPPLFDLNGREIYYNQGIMGFVSRLSSDVFFRKFITSAISLLAVIMASLFTLKKNSPKLSFSLFLITLPLVDTLSWQHHLVWLIFPFVLLTAYAIRLKNTVILGLIAIAYLLVSWNFKNPSLYLSFPKILLLSNQFYGAVILWGINVYLLIKNNAYGEKQKQISQ